jgi:hypothetical protein
VAGREGGREGGESAAVRPKKKDRPEKAPTLEEIFHDVDACMVVQILLWFLGTYLRFNGILNGLQILKSPLHIDFT